MKVKNAVNYTITYEWLYLDDLTMKIESKKKSALNLVGHIFQWSPFIHNRWVYVDNMNPKPKFCGVYVDSSIAKVKNMMKYSRAWKGLFEAYLMLQMRLEIPSYSSGIQLGSTGPIPRGFGFKIPLMVFSVTYPILRHMLGYTDDWLFHHKCHLMTLGN